ncbi:hypothetical protein PN462_10850 [Spirulina sp. CS-785/01]|uniref:hypothetical protein n=1 Tax=Spirulina sp. CS-785/01 TaxID=3021716 RepID=UPI00232D6140|nr:hypothetical protein [Spirulina sp. CS-785/01]MDB9313598.1 hypothetical protein [Spirulina sp. CS-785/01]
MTDPLIRSIVQQIQSWFSQANKAVESQSGLVDLPVSLQTQLWQEIQGLSTPMLYQRSIQDAIASAVENWQNNLEAPNSLVLLGNPVEPITQILEDSLDNWPSPILPPKTLLPTLTRPPTPEKIKSQLQKATKPYQQQESSQTVGDTIPSEQLEDRKTLLVIPCLEQCFLRCIGGWEGIEYLRDVVLASRDCFWVIGCNHWAWDFLNFVCQINAYFDQVQPLPELEGEACQDWLDAIAKTVIALDSPEEDQEKRRHSYWKSLASQSSGISSIAASLWLQSLRISPDDFDEDTPPSLNSESLPPLQETQPSLPHLPPLTVKDRYILHSVLIHGRITRSHLALSLGESASIIQSYVQVLIRKGLLQQQQGQLSIYAAHYVKLKTELANNNFFVGED